MTNNSNPGEDKAWEMLLGMKPGDVCRATGASHDPATGCYTLRSFNMDFAVSTNDRTIFSSVPGSSVLLTRLAYFFKLSILWYLVSAKDIPCTGRLLKLQSVRNGDIFTRGSHTLPLESVANKYGKDKEGFIEKGKQLGGEIMVLGDASIKLFPFPGVPVILTLWLEDDEFPSRVDLLLDSTCDLQVPTDIIWSIAMMSVLILL